MKVNPCTCANKAKGALNLGAAGVHLMEGYPLLYHLYRRTCRPVWYTKIMVVVLECIDTEVKSLLQQLNSQP